MGFVGLLQFAVKCCLDFLAWPLLALGYPLCASIRAIENNSVSDTQKLNTYWVVLSLILLLEHALNLLEWFMLWPYIRLMIVCWLVIPYFDGAFYVYKHLIRPCLSLDLQKVINWFNKRMESSYANDNFLTEMEKYVNDNGPEALEKIIGLKSGSTKQNLDVKDVKAVSSTENKEVEQLNSERPTVTQKDIGAIEVLEKKEVKAAKQDSVVQQNVTQIENRSFAGSPGIKKTVPEVAAQREPPQAPASSKVQTWTCKICQITLQSMITMNSHLQGKKHQAAVEALNAKNQSSGPKVAPTCIPKNSDRPNVEPGKSASKKGYSGNVEVRGQQQCNPASIPRKSEAKKEAAKSVSSNGVKQKVDIKHKHEEKVQAQQAKKPNKGSFGINSCSLCCSICNVNCTSESDMASHLGGRRHLDALQSFGINSCSLYCSICNINCTSESNMASHLGGKKHLAALQQLST